MAGTKISALGSLSTLADTTLIPVVDAGTNYKMAGSVLQAYTRNSIAIGTPASASGGGALSYNSSTGQFTFTPAASYSLPTASTTVLGGVKIDGSTITLNGSNQLVANYTNYTLPTASTTVLGGVKIDGSTITLNGSNQLVASAAAAGSLTGNTLASGVLTSSLTTVGTLGSLTVSGATTVKDVRDTVYAIGTVASGNFAPDAANGDVQTATLSSGTTTFTGFANAAAGQTVTFILTQPSSGSASTWATSISGGTILYAGGVKSLTATNSSVDMVVITHVGSSVYYASIVNGFTA